jgi:CDP-paratose 2-epimerase
MVPASSQVKLFCKINRCGLLSGPFQMGKVDQGVVALWVARHFYKSQLSYVGFGGEGKQVRDMMHIEDLFDLLIAQSNDLTRWNGAAYNVGGGRDISTSLKELTEICREITGNKIPIESVPATSPVDIRIYLTDASKAKQHFQWKPKHSVQSIVTAIHVWIQQDSEGLRPILMGGP